MRKPESSPYVNRQRREYSLYVMRMRAIPSACDGLKAGQRRVLWTARDGKHWKSASLAGATMPIHPHASPEGSINTLAAPYGNNIRLFYGDCAFGTLLKPTAYGAARYTDVTITKFTKDVVFKDIEVIPMTENYDGSLEEPVHFLPLVPMALVNPAEGVAIGFATNILPRGLDDIILAQITHLKGGKKINPPMPKFLPIDCGAYHTEPTERGVAYYFNGEVIRKDTSTAIITKLPYGQLHAKVIDLLDNLVANDVVVDYVDGSKNEIKITVKFAKGYLKKVEDVDLYKMLGLSVRHIENLNVIDFDGDAVMSTDPVQLIREFTDWRLSWYVKRYERLRDMQQLDLQRYYDIRTAIKHNVGGSARKVASRVELKELLQGLGIVSLDYIADLPVYRFTEEERLKNEQRIKEAEAQLKVYEDLLSSEDDRKKVYISELQDVLTKYTKGVYNEQ